MSETSLALAGSLVLAGVHALSPLLERVPRERQAWLASLVGGAGLSYVFLYLLFELAKEGAPKIHALAPLGPEPLETLFILLLAALAATYMLQIHLERTPHPADDHRGFASLFCAYNAVAGAGLLEEAHWGALNMGFYAAAIGMHMVFNDRFLLHLCPAGHSKAWRLTLAVAPVLGCAAALALQVPDGLLYGLLALIAGGTILGVLRVELPDLPGYRPWGFAVGVVGYAALIFATWRF